jgi:hypothetical protein
LTFTKIGKDVFPDATKAMLNMSEALGTDVKSSALQLGKALNDPIRGMTALTRAGVSFTQEQKDMVKQLQNSGDMVGAQKLILKELEVQFGGSAAAARNTFGGALKSLENIQGDIMEDIGRMTAAVGKDLVEQLIKGANAFRTFITSGLGLDLIADAAGFFGGALAVLSDIVNDRLKDAFDYINRIIKPIADRFSSLKKNSSETSVVFQALAAGSRLMSIGLSVMSKIVATAINALFNLAEIVQKNIKIVQTLWNVLNRKATLKEVTEAIGESLEAFKDFGKGLLEDTGNIVKETIDQFKKLPTEVGKQAIEMETKFKSTFDRTKQNIVNSMSGAGDEIESKFTRRVLTQAEIVKVKWAQFWDGIKQKAQEAAGKIAEGVGKIKDVFDKVSSMVTAVWSGVTDTIKMAQDNEMTELKNHNAKILEQLSEQQKKELELANSGYESQLQQLEVARERGAITEEEYTQKKEQIEKTNTENLEGINKKYNDQVTAQNEDFRKKEYEQKKRAFETDKAFKIAQIWLNVATAIMGFWSSLAPMGIPGIIMAGIMTGVVTGFGIAQTVLVSQQQMPAFRQGGTVGKGSSTVRMNEEGGEIATLPDGTVIVPHDISARIADAAGSRQTINVSFAGANITDNMSLEKITNHVVRAMGRQLRAT